MLTGTHASSLVGEVQHEALRRELERVQALASRDRGLLATILRHSPHGILVYDARGRVVVRNRAAERIWAGGANTTALTDWPDYEAFHPDGRPYAREEWSVARALGKGEVVEAEELDIRRFDGSPGVLLASTAPFRDPAGAIQGAVWVFADITRFKENERALLARERSTGDRLARLHAFTAALSEAADGHDVARVTVEHGQAALRASSGYLYALRDGKAELVHSAGVREAVRTLFGQVSLDGESPVAATLRNGEPVWVGSRAEHERSWPEAARRYGPHVPAEYALAVLPLEVRAGRLGAVAFTFAGQRTFEADDRALLLAIARQAAQALDRAQLLDTARRAWAEAEAAQARTAFLSEASALLASSLDTKVTLTSVARLAVPRVGDWCTIDLVQATSESPAVVAHADPAKVELAREVWRLHPPDPDAPRGVPNVLRTGKPELFEEISDELRTTSAADAEHLAALRKLGVRSAMIVPMAARGRILGVLTFAAAESGRRYGQADLEMAQHLARRAALAIDNARLYADAQQAIRARDDVLAIVSHDLRNPLHAIGMASNLLARPSMPPDRVRAHAAAIERSARRMGRLIRDLLESSRIESGRFSLERQPTVAGAILAEAAALLSPLAAEKQISVALETASEPIDVYCDRERIVQVFSNLIGNAVNFTPRGGRITLGAVTAGDQVRFSVADSGVGIPPEHQLRIFDRYWKSRESRQGTGLGLAIAKGIVEAHGGRIWVESRAGEGATFHFTLPRSAQATSTPLPGALPAVR